MRQRSAHERLLREPARAVVPRVVLAAAAALAAVLATGGCASEPASPDEPVLHEPPSEAPGGWFHDDPYEGGAAPALVAPRPGMAGVRPHPFERVLASADDQVLRLAFWGGVAPCFVLDRVEVKESPESVTVALYAGSDPASPDVACIEIATYMAVDVTLPSPLAGRSLVDGADGATKPLPR